MSLVSYASDSDDEAPASAAAGGPAAPAPAKDADTEPKDRKKHKKRKKEKSQPSLALPSVEDLLSSAAKSRPDFLEKKDASVEVELFQEAELPKGKPPAPFVRKFPGSQTH